LVNGASKRVAGSGEAADWCDEPWDSSDQPVTAHDKPWDSSRQTGTGVVVPVGWSAQPTAARHETPVPRHAVRVCAGLNPGSALPVAG